MPRATQVLKRQDMFLDAFKKTGTILGACRRTGISREIVRIWRRDDKAFEDRFQDCDLDITETLETKAMSLAMAGEKTLIMFLLNARAPHKYRHRMGISVDSPVPLNITLSDDRGGDEPKKDT